MDKRFEKLKSALFSWGTDYIEEFLGFEIDSDWEKDTIDNAMDEVYEQMPEEELEVFYQKFLIDWRQWKHNFEEEYIWLRLG